MKFHPDVENAIARIVGAGGTVKLPIPCGTAVLASELDEIDRRWSEGGRVRVRQEHHSNYFPSRVAALRRERGMACPAGIYSDSLVFEPEPAKEGGSYA